MRIPRNPSPPSHMLPPDATKHVSLSTSPETFFCRRNRWFVISVRAMRLIASFETLRVLPFFRRINPQVIQSRRAASLKGEDRQSSLLAPEQVKWILITLSPQMQSNPHAQLLLFSAQVVAASSSRYGDSKRKRQETSNLCALRFRNIKLLILSFYLFIDFQLSAWPMHTTERATRKNREHEVKLRFIQESPQCCRSENRTQINPPRNTSIHSFQTTFFYNRKTISIKTTREKSLSGNEF